MGLIRPSSVRIIIDAAVNSLVIDEMFLIWGSTWQYEIKSGGLRVQKKCPECDRTGEFIEVKPTKYFTLYFIPLIETESKRTVLECPYCKSHFYIHKKDYLAAKQEWQQYSQTGQKSQQAADNKPREDLNRNIPRKIITCHCGKNLRVPLMEKLIKITCPGCHDTLHVASGEII